MRPTSRSGATPELNSIDLHIHSDASDDGEWQPERIAPPEQCSLYREAAQSRSLLLSGGSDFHGKTKPAIHLGRFPCAVPGEQIIEALLERIAMA